MKNKKSVGVVIITLVVILLGLAYFLGKDSEDVSSANMRQPSNNQEIGTTTVTTEPVKATPTSIATTVAPVIKATATSSQVKTPVKPIVVQKKTYLYTATSSTFSITLPNDWVQTKLEYLGDTDQLYVRFNDKNDKKEVQDIDLSVEANNKKNLEDGFEFELGHKPTEEEIFNITVEVMKEKSQSADFKVIEVKKLNINGALAYQAIATYTSPSANRLVYNQIDMIFGKSVVYMIAVNGYDSDWPKYKNDILTAIGTFKGNK